MSLGRELTLIERIENVAVEVARVAGAEITHALGREIAVRYKGGAGEFFEDPVSEVDPRRDPDAEGRGLDGDDALRTDDP